MEGLRDFSDVQVMTRGVEVAGDVRDEHAHPVAGAEVGWLEASHHQTFHDDMPTTTTDQNGRFRFPHARPGELMLQVKATGHAPGLATVHAQDQGKAVSITLGRAHTLEGRVVDSQGKPITDAFIVIDTWRKYRSIGVFLKTDSNGRFRWNDAPPDSVLVDASRSGFTGEFHKRVSPDEEAVFTLKRSLSISGRVFDAKTKKPIDDVSVDFGSRDAKSGAIVWGGNRTVFAHQGHLQGTVDVERTPEFQLRFRQGLCTARVANVSRRRASGRVQRQPDTNRQTTGNCRLGTRSSIRRSTTRRREVGITYPMAGGRDRLPYVRIENGKLQADQAHTTTKTDATGHFSLTREPDPLGRHFAVVVVHPNYYAEVAGPLFQANPTIVAMPWGRVEGVARVGPGRRPGARFDILPTVWATQMCPMSRTAVKRRPMRGPVRPPASRPWRRARVPKLRRRRKSDGAVIRHSGRCQAWRDGPDRTRRCGSPGCRADRVTPWIRSEGRLHRKLNVRDRERPTAYSVPQ